MKTNNNCCIVIAGVRARAYMCYYTFLVSCIITIKRLISKRELRNKRRRITIYYHHCHHRIVYNNITSLMYITLLWQRDDGRKTDSGKVCFMIRVMYIINDYMRHTHTAQIYSCHRWHTHQSACVLGATCRKKNCLRIIGPSGILFFIRASGRDVRIVTLVPGGVVIIME